MELWAKSSLFDNFDRHFSFADKFGQRWIINQSYLPSKKKNYNNFFKEEIGTIPIL